MLLMTPKIALQCALPAELHCIASALHHASQYEDAESSSPTHWPSDDDMEHAEAYSVVSCSRSELELVDVGNVQDADAIAETEQVGWFSNCQL